jgi:hypothetical protein
MKDLGLLVFSREQTLDLLAGLEIKPDGRGTLRKSSGDRITCSGCETAIKVNQFGAALHGSKLFYCDNPACLAHYVDYKLRGSRKASGHQFDLSNNRLA